MSDLASLERRIDELTLPLLMPLRATKHLDGVVMSEVLTVGREMVDALEGVHTVPKTLVGKAWFIFTAMLIEADHCREPGPILDAAWQWQECLRHAFGPRF